MNAFFNPTALKKNITRFAPLWGLYTVFMLLFLLLIWDSEGEAAFLANQASTIMGAMGFINFVYAGICALVLFGDLFTPRMCNMLHALPMRREGWFFTHLLSGLLFCAVPNLLGALIAAALLGPYSYIAFLWLGLMLLQFLFFFGMGSFCALCAGSKLGSIAVYLICNFLSVLAAFLLQVFYEPLLYGVSIDMEAICRLSPVVMFSGTPFIETHYDNMTGITVVEAIPSAPWIYAGVAAGVGIALLAVALLLYRKRNMESAGDLISVKPAAPVLLVIYTLCVGATLYFFATNLDSTFGYLFLLIGLIIGFFTGRMLLEKRVQVFRGKNFLSFGILVVAFAISMTVTRLDPLGITRYVPEEAQIEAVTVSPYRSDYSINRQSCLLTEAQDIADIRKLHADAIRHPGSDTDFIPLHLHYELKSGITLDRTYDIPESLGYADLIQGYYSRPICVLGAENAQELLSHMSQLDFYPYEDGKLPYVYIGRTTQYDLADKYGENATSIELIESGSFADNSTAKAIMEAVYADCLAGNMSQWWNPSNAVAHLQLQITYGQYPYYWDITIYESSENTLACLQQLAEAAAK